MLNRIILIGRLTADAELRYLASGTGVCNFTLAIDRDRKDAQGNKQTDFMTIIAWQKLAELCAQYLKKGRQAAVCGRMESRSYENKEGQKVRVWEVVADQVEFIGGSNDAKAQPTKNAPDPFADDSTPIDIDDDSLPF